MFGKLAKGSHLMQSAWTWGKGLLGIGVGATVVGGGAVMADQTLNQGRMTGGIVEGIGAAAGRGIQEYAQTTAAGQRDAEVANASSGFQGFFEWVANIFSILGLDSLAKATSKIVDKIEKRAFERDQERKAQRDENEFGPSEDATLSTGVANPGVDPNASVIEAGEVSFGSAFGSAAYGLETGVVSMGAGVTSLVSGSWEALTTDKGWGASISDDFNAQKNWTMSKLENLHGKPVIDTPLERNLATGGEFASWLVPAGLAAKATGSIVGGLANAGKVEPALAYQAAPKLLLTN